MPSSRNSPKILTKKPPLKKPKKAALSKPSGTPKKLSSRIFQQRPALAVSLALEKLKTHYPDAHCALDHESAFQLLIATILSAQCTDERVNIVTKELFKKYPDAAAMSQAPVADLEVLIRSAGFYKNKARNILECSRKLMLNYGGVVPQLLEQLTDLAGVGRKTANVVLGNAFQITSGIVVDTHVTRLSNRFKWTKQLNPEKIELDLQKLIPHKDWILIAHLLIFHGRSLCKARNPLCEDCFLADRCPSRQ